MWLLACFTAGADGGPCSWSSRSRATASQQPAASSSQPAGCCCCRSRSPGCCSSNRQSQCSSQCIKTIRTGTYVPVQQYIVYTS
jgi:hypothetical protein